MTVQENSVQAFVAARAQRPAWPGVPHAMRPATIADGYDLQRAVHDRLGRQGVSRVGYKVGSTSAAGQRIFGLHEPVYAGIFTDGRADTLAAGLARPLVKPALECEIALLLRADIDAANGALSPANIADAVDTCHIACEIIDHRYGDPLEVGVPSLLADDFFHAGFVIGAANPDWRRQDLTRADATIEIDGNSTAGNAGDVLSAFAAVQWLAAKLASVGTRLRAGEFILTGSITVPVPIALPATTVALSISGFAPLTLRP